MKSLPTLTTARLVLRQFTLADAPSIQRLAGAPEVAAGTFLPHPYEDSGQVLHKIGMQYEGCQREHYRHGDRFEDTQLYGILRRDFDAC